MTKEMPQPEDAPDSHPTAGSKIESWRDVSERVERLADGEVEIPWPYTAKSVAMLSGANLVAAGASFALEVIVEPTGGWLFIVTLVLVLSAIGFGHYARFLHRHFDKDPKPRYVDE